MAGLGWQEFVIVLVILLIIAIPVVAIFAIARAVRDRQSVRAEGAQGPEYARFWLRAAGEIADSLILLIPSRVASAVGERVVRGENGLLAGSLAAWVVALAYVVIGNGRGATLGKRWAKLRVVDADGAVPGLRRAAVRAIIPLGLRLSFLIPLFWIVRAQTAGAAAVSGWVFVVEAILLLLIALDYLWMIRDPRKQTLHDKLAGTFVVLA